jgi:tetratricopeptide (TPR) repeat protein
VSDIDNFTGETPMTAAKLGWMVSRLQENRASLNRLLLTGLLATITLPSFAAVPTARTIDAIAQPQSSPILQLAQASSAPNQDPEVAADLAPAIAQLKGNNPAAAEALLLKLQAQNADRLDVYRYLTFSQLLQGKYADALIEGIDRGFQGKDNSLSDPPSWLAARIQTTSKFSENDPPPTFIQELEQRVAAQPEAIAPRLALLAQLSRPQRQISSPAAQRDQKRQQQIEEFLQRHGQNTKVLSFLILTAGDSLGPAQQGALLERSLKLDPSQIDQRQALAQLRAVQGKFAEAQTLLSDGLTLAKPEEKATLWASQAEIEAAIGNLPAALALYKTSLASQPEQTSPYGLFRIAQELGQLDSAIALYDTLAKTQPTIAAQAYIAASSLLETTMVETSEDKANTARALALLQKAHKLDPNNVSIAIQLIDAYRNRDRNKEALQLAEAFHQRNPDDNDGTLSLIGQLSLNNQADRALKLGQRQIKKDPDSASAVLSNLLRGIMAEPIETLTPAQNAARVQQATRDGMALTEKLVSQYPSQTAALYQTLTSYLSSETSTNQILAIYNKLQQLDPKNGEYPLQTAWLLQISNRSPEAVNVLQSLLRRDPNNSPAQIALGQILLEQQKFPDAIAAFKAAAALDPDTVYTSGSSLQESQQYGAAKALYETALKTDPNNPLFLGEYGHCLEKLSQTDPASAQALATYRQALAATPIEQRSESVTASRLVQLMIRQGQFDNAITEAIAIASTTRPSQSLGDSSNPFSFLSYSETETDPGNQRIYQAIITKLTPQGPSTILAAAHETLGFRLLTNAQKAEGTRHLDTAQAMYKQLGRPDRAFNLTKQMKQLLPLL